jgi:hypothetical protein
MTTRKRRFLVAIDPFTILYFFIIASFFPFEQKGDGKVAWRRVIVGDALLCNFLTIILYMPPST